MFTTYIAMAEISFMNRLVIATVEVMAADPFNPLYGEIYPRVVTGNFDNNRLFLGDLRNWLSSQAITPNRFNLGQLLFHLKAQPSLVPWVAVTSALGLLLYRTVMNLDEIGRHRESKA